MGNELESTIDRWHDGLRELAGRLEILEAFIAELEKAANRKPFEIWNDIVWHLMQDCRRLLVVDLASWSKSVNRKGGFIGLLRGQHGTAFKRRLWGQKKKHKEKWLNDYIKKMFDEQRKEALHRLFPDGSASETGFEALKEKIGDQMERADRERDQGGAHRFEHGGAQEFALGIEEIRKIVDQAEAVMRDIRLVAAGNTLGEGNAHFADERSTAEELVDMVLLGAPYRRRPVRQGMSRDDYYRDRHAKHDARSDKGSVNFNSNWKDEELPPLPDEP